MVETHRPKDRFPLPGILRHNPPLASVAAFFGSFEVLRTFVDLSFDPKCVDGFQRTIAHFSCAGGSFDCCRELDLYGVDFEAVDGANRNPAEYAAEMGRLDLLQWLWTRGSLNAMTEIWREEGAEEPEILRRVAKFGHADVLKFLIDVVGAPVYKSGALPSSGKTTAVHTACEGGHADALEVLLDRGGNPTKVDGAARMPVILAIQKGSLSCVKLLFERGVLTRAFRRHCPVVEAARFGHLDVLRFLVNVAGFDINATGDGGETALAAATRSGHWACARWLFRDKDIPAAERNAAALAALTDDEPSTAAQAALFAAAVASPGGALLTSDLVDWLGHRVPGPNRRIFGSRRFELQNDAGLVLRFSSCAWFDALVRGSKGKAFMSLAINARNADLLRLLVGIRGPPTPDELGLFEPAGEELPWFEKLAEAQPDWRCVKFWLEPDGGWTIPGLFFVLQRGPALEGGSNIELGLMIRRGLFTDENLRELARFEQLREDLIAVACETENVTLLTALSPTADDGGAFLRDHLKEVSLDDELWLRALGEYWPNWSRVRMSTTLDVKFENLIFALERGVEIHTVLRGQITSGSFAPDQVLELVRFPRLRPNLISVALSERNIALLRALAPMQDGEVVKVSLHEDLSNRPWLEALAEVQPDWRSFSCEFRGTSVPIEWSNVVFAVRHGAVLSRWPDVGTVSATAPLNASEALEVAAVDRKGAFLIVLRSHDAALLAALNEAGFVPNAYELDSVDWFGESSTREWLEAVAAYQPDWSGSYRAAWSIFNSGSEDDVRIARQHHAPDRRYRRW